MNGSYSHRSRMINQQHSCLGDLVMLYLLQIHVDCLQSSKNMLLFLSRLSVAYKVVSLRVWSWKSQINATPTLTGWRRSLSHVALYFGSALTAMMKTAQLTFGVTFWHQRYIRLDGVHRMGKHSSLLMVN